MFGGALRGGARGRGRRGGGCSVVCVSEEQNEGVYGG